MGLCGVNHGGRNQEVTRATIESARSVGNTPTTLSNIYPNKINKYQGRTIHNSGVESRVCASNLNLASSWAKNTPN
jgi:hypothetical protein